ncbi:MULTISPECIES: hypothetical protein [Roseiflexus]|jgi:hypothetical protein|uniref:Uncharacterized protein n=1 Tax=Roseiflexus castenholzii (strain DSM 13941 / HLO8) TaxID=383372 RepID=A7NMG1_ROSCS|nr:MULTISPECIES: hypothetical protein [Roseiflexus]ABU58723.1 conserved hypothetical protein [Roseiflexus castenholzii DSM 13941]GIW01698.1 MAG: hypothetical protein KatS3mg058_3101 [Roseiflexus sp.]
MSSPSAAWWRKARRVRDRMIARFGAHPAVTGIDIGLLDPPEAGVIGVRIHVRGNPDDMSVPEEIDGIPVGIVRGDYHLQ